MLAGSTPGCPPGAGSYVRIILNGTIAAVAIHIENVTELESIKLVYNRALVATLFSASAPFNATRFSTHAVLKNFEYKEGLKVKVHGQKVIMCHFM